MSDEVSKVPSAMSSQVREKELLSWAKSEQEVFARSAQRFTTLFYGERVLSLLLAATITVTTGLMTNPVRWVGLLGGAALGILQGLEHLFQWSNQMGLTRVTANALRVEQQTFQSRTASYATAPDPVGFFGERVAALVSDETSSWAKAFHSSATASAGGQRSAYGDARNSSSL